jgi:hypothetical protein
MARYLAYTCPRCKGYLGVVIPEGKRNRPVKAINGLCAQCGYRLAWLMVLGKQIETFPASGILPTQPSRQ